MEFGSAKYTCLWRRGSLAHFYARALEMRLN